MEPILQTENLTKIYNGKYALNGVNMTVQRGDIYGFIGQNGAGKTTLMRLALGLSFPSRGKISLFGGESPAEARRKIGSLVETPSFYRGCSARENLRRFSLLTGGKKEDIDAILELVGLDKVGGKKAGKFSLGMKQRLGIGIALLGHPEFMILDEPVNGLDPTGIRDMRDLILRLNRECGITFLISSHLLDELSKIATRYGIINQGNLLEEITPEQLQEKCRSSLSVQVDNTEAAAAAVYNAYPGASLSMENGTLRIPSDIASPGEINRILTDAGITVSGLTTETVDLESYFTERIGGAHV